MNSFASSSVKSITYRNNMHFQTREKVLTCLPCSQTIITTNVEFWIQRSRIEQKLNTDLAEPICLKWFNVT